MEFRKELGRDLRRLIGDVAFEHDGAYLYCDSAYFWEEGNRVDAYGHIRIKVSDTLNIYGDLLQYDGNTRVADLIGKVKMVDRQTTLTTERLIYDRNSGIASYHTGANITNKENRLTSRNGYYYTGKKQFFFKEKVELNNPRNRMKCDTLMYQTLSRTAYFKGPTRITSSESFIYCENGWYNTNSDIAQFQKNAYLISDRQKLSGDSLYYDRNKGIGRAFHNVHLIDTVQNIIITGHLGDYRKMEGYARVTDSVVGILIESQDSLFIHGDTLFAMLDTLGGIQRIYAYHKVKFYRNDLQGMSDSLIYNLTDSTISLFKKPVLWSDENQLTADSIRLWITDRQADSMLLYQTAFIVSLADSGKYNQIKGRSMTGYFSEGRLHRVKVLGNARTIYFAREDDGSSIGINLADASDMLITLENKKIKKIKYLNKPGAVLYPETKAPPDQLSLPGFQWLEHRRPSNRTEIFNW